MSKQLQSHQQQHKLENKTNNNLSSYQNIPKQQPSLMSLKIPSQKQPFLSPSQSQSQLQSQSPSQQNLTSSPSTSHISPIPRINMSQRQRQNDGLIDILPIYSPRTSYKKIRDRDDKMIADMTLNFDKVTIQLLKEEFLAKNNELELEEFIIIAKRHLKFWQIDAPNRDLSLVRYLTYLFNEIDINGNGDMEWEEFTNYVIEKATVLKHLKSKADEVKHYVKSDSSFGRARVDQAVHKMVYLEDIGRVAFFQQGTSRISFFSLNTGEPSSYPLKPLILDSKNLIVNISSVKKQKNGKSIIRKKDLILPTHIRVLDMLYLGEKKYCILVVSTSDGWVRGYRYHQNNATFVKANQPDNEEQLFEHLFGSEIYTMAWDNINQVLYCGQKNGSIYLWNLKTDLEKILCDGRAGAGKDAGKEGKQPKGINQNMQQNNSNTKRSAWGRSKLAAQQQQNQQRINHMITAMITMPKLQFMASGRMDGRLLLWDTINNTKKCTYKEHTRGIMALAFNETMILLFSGGFDHKICIWNPYISTLIHKIEGHLSPILSLKVIEQSQQLVSMDSQGIVKVVDTKRFNILYSFTVDMSGSGGSNSGSSEFDYNNKQPQQPQSQQNSGLGSNGIGSAAQLLKSTLLNSGGKNGGSNQQQAYQGSNFNTTNSNQLPSSSSGHNSHVSTLLAVENPLKLIFAGRGFTSYEYDKNYNPDTADESTTICCRYVASLLSFFTPAGNKIKVWSALNGDIEKIYMDVTPSPNEISTFAFDYLQKRMIIGDSKGNITLHNTVNGAKMKTLAKHQGQVTHLISTQNDSAVDIFISCGIDNEIKVVKETEESFEIIRTVYLRKDITVCSMKYLQKLKTIAVGTSVGMLVFYDVQTGKNTGTAYMQNAFQEVTSINEMPTLALQASQDESNKLASGLSAMQSSGEAPQFPLLVAVTSSGTITVVGLPPLPMRFQRVLTFQHFDEEKLPQQQPLGIRCSCYSAEEKRLFVIDDKMYLICYSFAQMVEKLEQTDYTKEKTESQRRHLLEQRVFWGNKIASKEWVAKAHTEIVKSIQYVSKQGLIITSSFDKKVKIWSSRTGEYIDSFRQNYAKRDPDPIGYLDSRNKLLYSGDKTKALPNVVSDLKQMEYNPLYWKALIQEKCKKGKINKKRFGCGDGLDNGWGEQQQEEDEQARMGIEEAKYRRESKRNNTQIAVKTKSSLQGVSRTNNNAGNGKSKLLTKKSTIRDVNNDNGQQQQTVCNLSPAQAAKRKQQQQYNYFLGGTVGQVSNKDWNVNISFEALAKDEIKKFDQLNQRIIQLQQMENQKNGKEQARQLECQAEGARNGNGKGNENGLKNISSIYASNCSNNYDYSGATFSFNDSNTENMKININNLEEAHNKRLKKQKKQNKQLIRKRLRSIKENIDQKREYIREVSKQSNSKPNSGDSSNCGDNSSNNSNKNINDKLIEKLSSSSAAHFQMINTNRRSSNLLDYKQFMSKNNNKSVILSGSDSDTLNMHLKQPQPYSQQQASLQKGSQQQSSSSTKLNLPSTKISTNYFKRSMMKCIQNFMGKNDNNELIKSLKEQNRANNAAKKLKHEDFTSIYKMIQKNNKSDSDLKAHRQYIEQLAKQQTENMINSRKENKIVMDAEGASKVRQLCRLLINTDRKDQRPKILMKSIEIKGSNRPKPISQTNRTIVDIKPISKMQNPSAYRTMHIDKTNKNTSQLLHLSRSQKKRY